MGKAGSTALKVGAWFAWVLDLIGWIILLSGVSAMQSVRAFAVVYFTSPPGDLLGGTVNSTSPCFELKL